MPEANRRLRFCIIQLQRPATSELRMPSYDKSNSNRTALRFSFISSGFLQLVRCYPCAYAFVSSSFIVQPLEVLSNNPSWHKPPLRFLALAVPEANRTFRLLLFLHQFLSMTVGRCLRRHFHLCR